MAEPLNYEGPLPDAVVARVAKFLETPVTTDDGWPEIPQDDWSELHGVIQDIIEAKFQRDCDNDQGVEYTLCNRRHGRAEVIHVPYQTHTDADMETALFAISIASGIVEQLTRSMSFTVGERRRADARMKKMRPVVDFCASNGHIRAHDRILDFIEGRANNLFVGQDDTVWAPLGLSCAELRAVIDANIGKRQLFDEQDNTLLNAVNCMEGN